MSTIFDALKKSEESRQAGKVPSLQDFNSPNENRFWPKLLVGLLLLSLIAALALYWLKPKQVELPISNQTTPASAEPAQQAETGIEVSVVSYNDIPEQRFAIVNGKMTREGEFVRAGLKLISIDKQNVTFNHRGKIEVRQY